MPPANTGLGLLAALTDDQLLGFDTSRFKAKHSDPIPWGFPKYVEKSSKVKPVLLVALQPCRSGQYDKFGLDGHEEQPNRRLS